MKKLFLFSIIVLGFNLYGQDNEGVTNIMLIPNDYTDVQMKVMEEVIETMVSHEGFIDMHRSAGVFTPMGPSQDYKEIIEIHFKSMEYMSDWRAQMEKQVPEDRRSILAWTEMFFYMYKPND